jgi:hypothetical protein
MFRLLGENAMSSVLVSAMMLLGGIFGVFAFRVLFDLFFPDPPYSIQATADDEDYDY